jgi:hypothetical protein
MPTYIPIYQRRLDPNTGEPMYNPDGTEIMDLVDTIVVPDPPVIELTPEEKAIVDAQNAEILAQQSQSTQETSENP